MNYSHRVLYVNGDGNPVTHDKHPSAEQRVSFGSCRQLLESELLFGKYSLPYVAKDRFYRFANGFGLLTQIKANYCRIWNVDQIVTR